MPAYGKFHDKALKAMAVARPTTREDLLMISGVGETKVDRCGARFTAAIEAWET
jgi:ATP-dependent DNA helicase RecQ